MTACVCFTRQTGVSHLLCSNDFLLHNNPQFSTAKLIYLMGASGSGKDTLLKAIAGQAGKANLVVARRYITREKREGCEEHVPLSQAEFESRERDGDFLFNWRAHGFQYGIGREVLSELENGLHVILNGSRRYLATAQDIYPDLVPVCLEVSPEVLELRLKARGRETMQQVAARLERARDYASVIPDGITRVYNNAQIEDAAAQVLDLLVS